MFCSYHPVVDRVLRKNLEHRQENTALNISLTHTFLSIVFGTKTFSSVLHIINKNEANICLTCQYYSQQHILNFL